MKSLRENADARSTRAKRLFSIGKIFVSPIEKFPDASGMQLRQHDTTPDSSSPRFLPLPRTYRVYCVLLSHSLRWARIPALVFSRVRTIERSNDTKS